MDVKRVTKGTKEYADNYAEACVWWNFWKFPCPPIESLPSNMLCSYNEIGLACIGFLYCTDSSIAWLEFIVANPEQSKIERASSIEILLSSAKVLASALGFGVIFTCAKNQSLQNKLEKKYLKTDIGMTHYLGRL